MKIPGLKKIYFYFTSAMLFLLHLPFVFAKNKPFEGGTLPLLNQNHLAFDGILISAKNKLHNTATSLYDSLRLNLMGLSRQAFEYAIQGLDYLAQNGKIDNDKLISIVDFSQPSSRKRLFVIDLVKEKVVFNTFVAHGVNSGTANAVHFSNRPESNESSLGFYETRDTYMGGNGYSLRLKGLESGINDNALSRDIVVHGAAYVNERLAQTQGYIGRSWGCPAIPENLHKPIIDKIKNGTCLFIYSMDTNYLKRSKILHPAG